ncbi:hypothetical protein B9H02_11000 [Prosthecochloris sp. HL-130-GSB]|jgi:predicted peroxiredoxin|nr:hypothetical protein B9H02_11000 [Prosthecochloris sp. HL-130-GSB]
MMTYFLRVDFFLKHLYIVASPFVHASGPGIQGYFFQETRIKNGERIMMNLLRKTCALLALLTLGITPLQSMAADEGAKGLFVVVTSADAQTQMMAMVLSTQTVKQGKSVRMLLCGPGGELAVEGSEQSMLKPLDKSPQMLLKGLIQNGVQVEVCPLFLPNRGSDASVLIEGVTVAKPPVIAEKLREDDIKLFTF